MSIEIDDWNPKRDRFDTKTGRIESKKSSYDTGYRTADSAAGHDAGSAFVFLMKDEMSVRVQKSLLGFALGVMVAVSVWSLLIPAMEMEADSGKWSVMPAAVGFLLGIGFLLALD